MLGCLLLYSLLLTIQCNVNVTVYYNPPEYTLVPGKIDKKSGVAWGTFRNTSASNGWTHLSIESNPNFPDDVQSFALGVAEGYLTRRLISWDIENSAAQWKQFNMSGPPPKVVKWLLDQYAWADENAQKHGGTDPLWAQVGLTLKQLTGIRYGYNKAKESSMKHLDFDSLVVLSSGGDFMDVFSALYPMYTTDWSSVPSASEALKEAAKRGPHCSGLIQFKGQQGVQVGHATWAPFNMMNRIMKQYTTHFTKHTTAANSVAFSSYPLYLSSGDDFYVTAATATASTTESTDHSTDNNKVLLTVFETTLNVFNTTQYKHLTVQSLLTWQRVVAANRLSSSGAEWSKLFSQYNSGTYNNQWFVVDPTKVTPLTLQPGAVFMVEQSVGLMKGEDISNKIIQNNNYWGSYNIPYFEEIYDSLGYPAMAKKFGDQYIWGKCARANIFRRDCANSADFKLLMRQNNYQHDPLSHNNPGFAVASRFDLSVDKQPASAVGAIDAKVHLVGDAVFHAISGPTDGADVLNNKTAIIPPFAWNERNDMFGKTSHIGQPMGPFLFPWTSFPAIPGGAGGS